MRVLLTVSYDGTAYAGWQRQKNGIAVQQVLEEALADALGRPVSITGASRTDAGVHALAQAFHFDTDANIPPDKYPFVLNTRLPEDIRVQAGMQVPDDFSARFSTRGKVYTYRIHNAPHASAIYRNISAHVPGNLDVALMRNAAQQLLGTHDFVAYMASGSQFKTTVRTIWSAEVERQDDEIIFVIRGNAFLYNMVRIIVGTLIEIGQGRRDPHCFTEAFETKSRLSLGMTAPARGLELTRLYYPWDGEEGKVP